ncbi:MAG: tetratricopeptide repeat protein, partial [Polyangiaceae bacterium]|nr:tetratricopeptide repeat protein [Polyangiaceae bacterium]
DAAVLEYRNAVDKDAMFAPARQKLAEAYLKQGNGSAALRELVRAADLLPKDAEAQVKAGSLLLMAGRAEDAKARADKALAVNPKNVDALVLRANAMAGLKDLDGALKEMEQALSLDPRAAIQTNVGAIQAVRGNLPEAEAAFRQAVTSDPKSVAARIALGQFMWATAKPAEAEGAFKAAVAIDPANQLPNRALAGFYLRSGRAAEAEPYLKKAVETSGGVDAQLALADYYVGMKRPADAVAVLEKLGADQRYWALARARIAGIQHSEGKPKEALATVDEVVAKHPTMAAARVVRGRLFLADGRVDEALKDAQEAVRLDPKGAEAQYLLGTVQEARRDVDAAATAYAEVLKLNPRASTVQVRLAMLEMQRNALPAATQLAEQAATAQPGNLVAQLVLARSVLARGDVDRAAAITKALVEKAPESALVQNQAGMLALAKRDYAGARAAFEKALKLEPRLVEPLTALVALDLEEKKPAQARARIEERLKKTPDASVVLALAGRTWAITGDPVKAEELLKRAIDADASNFDAYSALAALYVSGRRLDEAVAEFDKLAARQPKAIGPPTLAALVLQAQGKEAEARQRFERLVEANPHAAVAANNLAYMYASKGEQLDRALQLAQAAKAEIPDHPEVNDTLGFVYLKKQLPSLAIAPLRLAVEKDPKNPTFHYHLGLAYSQNGDKAAARQSLEQALKLKPDFEGAEDAKKVLSTLG